jgi:hypothetical protein
MHNSNSNFEIFPFFSVFRKTRDDSEDGRFLCSIWAIRALYSVLLFISYFSFLVMQYTFVSVRMKSFPSAIAGVARQVSSRLFLCKISNSRPGLIMKVSVVASRRVCPEQKKACPERSRRVEWAGIGV